MGEDEERFCAQTRRGRNKENGECGAPVDPDREQRYAELFEQLDLNKDGRVDISELKTGLAARGLHQREAEEVRRPQVFLVRDSCRLMQGQVHLIEKPK